MSHKKRRAVCIALVAVGAAIAVVGLGVGGYAAFQWFMGQPLYRPGMARALPLDPPAQTGRSRFTVETGIELYTFSVGSGRRVLVVHGGPGLPFETAPQGFDSPALTASHELVFYDQRGAGRSSRPIDRFGDGNRFDHVQRLDRALGIAAQLADIERVRRILDEERLILVGHSYGGFLAALYASEFPERVQALVLVAPADLLVMPSPSGGLYEEVRERIPNEMRADYDSYLDRLFDFESTFSKSDAELAALHAEFGRYYAAALRSNGLELPATDSSSLAGGWMVQAQYFGLGKEHDYTPALASVRAPVLVIHGARDLQPESASRAYVDAVRHGELRVIDGAGHFPFYDEPERFATTLREFLDRVESAPVAHR